MGIPRFFLWVYKNYPECLHILKKYQTFKNVDIKIDSYSLDLNAIIHPVCQKMYNYGNGDRLLRRYNKKTPTHTDVFWEICKTIEKLRKMVNPSVEFIITIDGTAGMGKQNQQRQRRFKSSKEKVSGDAFDSNCITTGSKFMYELSGFIHNYIKRQLSTNPEWKSLNVMFSNEKVVGEGEHKIVRYIGKQSEKYTYCIHSPDADLIMLSMGLQQNVYIVRENIYKDADCEYFVVNVKEFKSIIYSMLRWVSVTHQCKENYLYYDFILLCMFLGNDFLPHIPSLDISNNGLDVLLQAYPRIASTHGHCVYRNKSGELCLNTKVLYYLFKKISIGENDMLIQQALDKTVNFPDNDLLNSLVKTVGVDGYTLNLSNYSNIRLNGDSKSAVCCDYFTGLLFVLRYYIDEMPDWNWYYPHHKSPLFSDMCEYITEWNGEKKFTIGNPLSPIQQLLSVLPPSSKHILPTALHSLVEKNSPIIDFYPDEFKIDLCGKRQEWEGHPILPFIDIQRLNDAYNSVCDNLTDEENKRNIPGKPTKYWWNDERVYIKTMN